MSATRTSSSTLAFGCVAESSPRFMSQALRLVHSLRTFGGSCSDAPFLVCVVGRPAHEYVRAIERMDASLHVVDPFEPRLPHANKIRLLEVCDVEGALVLLDCDTAVVQDPSTLLTPPVGGFAAKIADAETLSLPTLKRLLDHFALPIPRAAQRTTVTGARTIAYFNSGVVAVDASIRQRLASAWGRFVRLLLRDGLLSGPDAYFTDQAGLALATIEQGLPFRTLDNRGNFPLHWTQPEFRRSLSAIDPVVLHYHSLVDASGFLAPTQFAKAAVRIDSLNRSLAAAPFRQPHGQLFWDLRYSAHPELGPGIGSSGAPLAYKRELAARAVQQCGAESVLDVGCGDGRLAEVMAAPGYLGIDVSPEAVQSARAAHPACRFEVLDFLQGSLPGADQVVCFDVAIHIPRADAYLSCVKALVRAARRGGLVSGYEEPPATTSPIVHFHEALSVTLARAGATGVREVGRYRQVAVFSFNSPRAVVCVDADRRGMAFVVGAMRSGTTVLADLLGRSPRVAHCPFELKDVWSSVGGVAQASPKTRDRTCLELGADDARPGQREALQEAFEARVRALAPAKSKDAIFLNKNPHLANKLELVGELFPDARFVWVRRAPHRVVASLRRLFSDVCKRQSTWHIWPEPELERGHRCWSAAFSREELTHLDPRRVFPGGDPQFLAEYWLEANAAIAQSLERRPEQFIALDEEDLVADPLAVLARCEAFLGVPLTESPAAGLDPSRNEEWRHLLGRHEVQALLHFLEGATAAIRDPATKDLAVRAVADLRSL